jgi:hypothetical protein
MNDSEGPVKYSAYTKAERFIVGFLPAFITPLRLRILLGYTAVVLLGIFGWEQLASAWRYLVTLLAPVTALIGALFALKLSVVIVSIVTLIISVIKMFFGFLVMVLKPGILKAIFIPQLVSLAGWIHRKSARLQLWVGKGYDRLRVVLDSTVAWWKNQNRLDKLLLSGFLIPLLVLVLVVFVIERATAIFAVKKITEQVVQRTTKFVIKHFHRVPLIGGIPTAVASQTRKMTRKDDREDLVADMKNLGGEFYEPTGSNSDTDAVPASSDRTGKA